LIVDDAYRPHSYSEVSELVSAEAAARLHPDEEYGIVWYNRHKITARPASEPDSDGGRRYKKRQVRTLRPTKEWVPIPVPACLPRELVDRARAAFEANIGSERKRLARPWELRGLMRCSCGRKMGTHTIR
jgi:hypothetical protein